MLSEGLINPVLTIVVEGVCVDGREFPDTYGSVCATTETDVTRLPHCHTQHPTSKDNNYNSQVYNIMYIYTHVIQGIQLLKQQI